MTYKISEFYHPDHGWKWRECEGRFINEMLKQAHVAGQRAMREMAAVIAEGYGHPAQSFIAVSVAGEIRALPIEGGVMELYRHVKTGKIYEVICNAYFEWEPTTLAVVYRNKATGERWIRPASEFNDGRFVRVGQNPHETEGSDGN